MHNIKRQLHLIFFCKSYIASEVAKKLSNKDDHFIPYKLSPFLVERTDEIIDMIQQITSKENPTKKELTSLLDQMVEEFITRYNNGEAHFNTANKKEQADYEDCERYFKSEKRSDKYLELWDLKDNILTTYRNLAQELDIKNSLDLSNYFTYLLWNGYFSPTKKHTYTHEGKIIPRGFNSLPIFLGKGVCLNYSELLSDFLNSCDIEAVKVSCLPKKTKKDDDFKPDKNNISTKINISKKDISLFLILGPILLPTTIPLVLLIGKMYGNHAITLINGEKGLYFYDPTMILALNPEKKLKASIVNGQGTFDIKLGLNSFPDDPKVLQGILFDLFVENKTHETISKEDYNLSKERTLDLVHQNAHLLDDTYDVAKKHILRINEGVKKL